MPFLRAPPTDASLRKCGGAAARTAALKFFFVHKRTSPVWRFIKGIVVAVGANVISDDRIISVGRLPIVRIRTDQDVPEFVANAELLYEVQR